MAILVVGGSSKDIGKTSLVCGILSALRDFSWTAVKITGHTYVNDISPSIGEPARAIVWEESTAGQSTDTARYLAAGARRALLVTRRHEDVPIREIRQALGQDLNILYESNRIIDHVRPDVCLALMGEPAQELKPSFLRLLPIADALITFSAPASISNAPAGVPVFVEPSANQISLELSDWLRDRLHAAAAPST